MIQRILATTEKIWRVWQGQKNSLL